MILSTLLSFLQELYYTYTAESSKNNLFKSSLRHIPYQSITQYEGFVDILLRQKMLMGKNIVVNNIDKLSVASFRVEKYSIPPGCNLHIKRVVEFNFPQNVNKFQTLEIVVNVLTTYYTNSIFTRDNIIFYIRSLYFKNILCSRIHYIYVLVYTLCIITRIFVLQQSNPFN